MRAASGLALCLGHLCPGGWKQAGPARRVAASGCGQRFGMEDGELDVVSSAIKRSRKPSRSSLRYVCVCVCADKGSACGERVPSSRAHPGGLHVYFRCCGSFPSFALARGPATPPPGGARGNPLGSACQVTRKRTGRPRHEALRGLARWAATQARGHARVAAQVSEGGRAGGGTTGPRRAAQGPRCGPARLPDSTCCPGPPGSGARAKSRRPGNDAPQWAAASPRPGTPERKPLGNQEQPHRAGEGLGRRHLGRTQQGPTV